MRKCQLALLLSTCTRLTGWALIPARRLAASSLYPVPPARPAAALVPEMVPLAERPLQGVPGTCGMPNALPARCSATCTTRDSSVQFRDSERNELGRLSCWGRLWCARCLMKPCFCLVCATVYKCERMCVYTGNEYGVTSTCKCMGPKHRVQSPELVLIRSPKPNGLQRGRVSTAKVRTYSNAQPKVWPQGPSEAYRVPRTRTVSAPPCTGGGLQRGYRYLCMQLAWTEYSYLYLCSTVHVSNSALRARYYR
jgi:hypothetical protein